MRRRGPPLASGSGPIIRICPWRAAAARDGRVISGDVSFIYTWGSGTELGGKDGRSRGGGALRAGPRTSFARARDVVVDHPNIQNVALVRRASNHVDVAEVVERGEPVLLVVVVARRRRALLDHQLGLGVARAGVDDLDRVRAGHVEAVRRVGPLADLEALDA